MPKILKYKFQTQQHLTFYALGRVTKIKVPQLRGPFILCTSFSVHFTHRNPKQDFFCGDQAMWGNKVTATSVLEAMEVLVGFTPPPPAQ